MRPLDDAEKKAEKAGLERASTTKFPQQFEWLVRRQVEEEPFGSVATSANVIPRTTEQAVTRLRRLIGLPQLPPGRPKTE